jgi:16S rRNA U1498 N3-methylase RsmE
MISTANVIRVDRTRQVCHTIGMNKTTPVFSSWSRQDTRSIAQAVLDSERAERAASRAARQSGAVFTDWCISDRD